MASKDLRDEWSVLINSLDAFCKEAYKLYVINNWQWQREVLRVPTIEELHENAHSLAYAAYQDAQKNCEKSGVSSGRILVQFQKWGTDWQGTIRVIALEYRS